MNGQTPTTCSARGEEAQRSTTKCEACLIWSGILRPRGPNLQKTAMMILALVLLGATAGVVNLAFIPRGRFFQEGDPTLAYPFITDSDASVPSAVVVALSILLPTVVILIFHLVLYDQDCLPGIGKRVHHRMLISLLWLWISFLLATTITSILKFYDGRLRPDFYAMCDYKPSGSTVGYRTAMDNCDYDNLFGTSWMDCAAAAGFNGFTAGSPGSFDNCLDQDMLHQAQSSYPSGHASVSLAGLGFLAYFLYYSFNGRDLACALLRLVLPCSAVVGSIVIAASRPHDYWHNFSDVNFGMSVGFCCMVVCGQLWKFHMVFAGKGDLCEEVITQLRGTHSVARLGDPKSAGTLWCAPTRDHSLDAGIGREENLTRIDVRAKEGEAEEHVFTPIA